MCSLLFASCGVESEKEDVVTISHTRETLEPFLEEYCVDCHGPHRQKGQVRFDTLSWEINDNDTAQRWQDVLDQLNGGDMPPEDETQPLHEELTEALDLLTSAVLEAQQRLTDHGGEIKMRRLNQREYSETIESLFGFEVAYDDIPENGEIMSFDTVGAEQFFNSAHFEKYLELGRKISKEGMLFTMGARKSLKKERTEVEEEKTEVMRTALAELDRKMALKQQGKSWQEMGFKDEGEAVVTFRQWKHLAERPRRYLQYPKVDEGVYICDSAVFTTARTFLDTRAEYILRIRGGVHGEHDDIRKIARVFDRERIFGTLKMAGTPENPETVELRVRQPMGKTFFAPSFRESVPDYTLAEGMTKYFTQVGGPFDITDPRASLWIDWMEIEGPFYPEGRPPFEQILYPQPEIQGHGYIEWNETRVKDVLEQFAFEAFRRSQPEPEYLAGLYDLFVGHQNEGMSPRDSMIEVLAVVLSSPRFLFISEGGSLEEGERRKLDNRELAIRLSYYLWSSPPDDELYAADLSDPVIYEQQIDRMLADERVQYFRDGFINQWAELDRYDAITVDKKEYFRFNEGIQEDAKQEVREFFGQLISENLPASTLVDSDFVVINPALATHYGLKVPNDKGSQFQKVMLPANSPRGGMMTQTAFLMTGSNGERSSPVIRGALVMEKLLHDEPAPPPPNVPELGSDDSIPRTNREMVELHQQQAVCSSCHKKMDVIGFGLENFDTIGRWRDVETVGETDVVIEPGGTLPDGDAFTNVQELKSVLIKHEKELAHQLVESMMTYALGRTVEFSDADDVEAILKNLEEEKYRVRSMIREVALSPLFLKK